MAWLESVAFSPTVDLQVHIPFVISFSSIDDSNRSLNKPIKAFSRIITTIFYTPIDLIEPSYFCVLPLGISSSGYRNAGIICCSSSSLRSGALEELGELERNGSGISLSPFSFRCRYRRTKKKTASPINKTPMMTPMTIPAIAPPERPIVNYNLWKTDHGKLDAVDIDGRGHRTLRD